MTANKEFADDLTIYPFLDKMTFSMDPSLFDWDDIDRLSDADPGSKEYQKLMRKMRITGRNKNTPRRWRDTDES